MQVKMALAHGDHRIMSYIVKFCSLSNPLELCPDHFFSWPGGINKYSTVWLDGARPPPKYIFKNNMSLMNSDPRCHSIYIERERERERKRERERERANLH
jgi:hypothetical protein